MTTAEAVLSALCLLLAFPAAVGIGAFYLIWKWL